MLSAQYSPPARTTFLAPVARTASTSSCIPAAVYGCREFAEVSRQPPSRQQVQARVVFSSSNGNGSLNRSKPTEGQFAKVVATDVQNTGLWSRSGIGSCS